MKPTKSNCEIFYACLKPDKTCKGFKKHKTKKCHHLHANGVDCFNQTLCLQAAVNDLKLMGVKIK